MQKQCDSESHQLPKWKKDYRCRMRIEGAIRPRVRTQKTRPFARPPLDWSDTAAIFPTGPVSFLE